MTSNLLQTELAKLNNDTVKTQLALAVKILEDAGILNYLRLQGQANIIDAGRNASANAAEGARAAGYSQCLFDIQFFRELYLSHVERPESIKANYGATRRMIESGDYTKEELDEYSRTGKLPTTPGTVTTI